MRCHICNSILTTPTYDSDHQEFNPCDTCLSVIQDTVGSFGDKASAAEDELGEDQLDLPLVEDPDYFHLCI